MNVKIAIVTDKIYPFYTGGYEYYFFKIASRLSDIFDVEVYTSIASKESSRIKNISFVRFSRFKNYSNPKGEHSIYGILKYLISIVLNYRIIKDFDVVILNSIPYLGVPFLIQKLRKNAKIVVVFHEAWYEYPYGNLINRIKRYVLRIEIRKIAETSDVLFSVSKPTADSLKANYGSRNVITIPLGIDVLSIKESIPSAKKFDLVYLGRLSAVKHVEDLLLAVDILKNKGMMMRVAIIGEGPMKAKLEDIVSKRNLMRNVCFLGQISDKDKFSILKSSKIFIMPSEREGFSIATLEAMACGCVPVVAVPKFPELFGISQFVKDYTNGIYFPVSDIDTLALQIERLSTDRVLYLSLQASALKDSLDYSWEKSLNLVESYIKNINSI